MDPLIEALMEYNRAFPGNDLPTIVVREVKNDVELSRMLWRAVRTETPLEPSDFGLTAWFDIPEGAVV